MAPERLWTVLQKHFKQIVDTSIFYQLWVEALLYLQQLTLASTATYSIKNAVEAFALLKAQHILAYWLWEIKHFFYFFQINTEILVIDQPLALPKPTKLGFLTLANYSLKSWKIRNLILDFALTKITFISPSNREMYPLRITKRNCSK